MNAANLMGMLILLFMAAIALYLGWRHTRPERAPLGEFHRTRRTDLATVVSLCAMTTLAAVGLVAVGAVGAYALMLMLG